MVLCFIIISVQMLIVIVIDDSRAQIVQSSVTLLLTKMLESEQSWVGTIAAVTLRRLAQYGV
jgi:hypothetical protein